LVGILRVWSFDFFSKLEEINERFRGGGMKYVFEVRWLFLI